MKLDKAVSVQPLPGDRLYVTFPPDIQEGPRNRLPNYLEYCYVCERENYAPMVALNQCAWCGWKREGTHNEH